ncbi:phage tail terminator protein [Vibrio ziniensis]|uniref:DUF3168 domain-containing protein n=1 Tax=Vibrio ziniensis TaxID=2711221 RepID=A0A6G7CH99_9VIBR|nr:phage tail terminator protein [Vibrio ziniensis]QIH41454.1 hypothetical protein G5S32_05345 [Vibrio ziniensis]
MEINDLIRKQVIADLTAALNPEEGEPTIVTFFNGLPSYIEVPQDPLDDDVGDLPAIAVALADGQMIEADMSENTWSATLIVRIYLLANTHVDAELDEIGKKVLSTIGAHYSGNGLLDTCNRSGFEYGRDDEQPWGMLDLLFKIEYIEEV